MKRLLSLLLVIAMLLGVCTVFTACDSTSVSDEDDDDKKKDDKESKKDTFQGLQIGLPKSFKKGDAGESYVIYNNKDYEVYINYDINYDEEDADDLQEQYEEQLEEGIEEGHFIEGKAGKTDKKTYYIYAILADENSATVVAFYTTDNSVWIVDITNTAENEDCNAAILRMVPQIDMDAIHSFIDEVPFLTDLQRTFYKTYLDARYDLILMPVYDELTRQQPGFMQMW